MDTTSFKELTICEYNMLMRVYYKKKDYFYKNYFGAKKLDGNDVMELKLSSPVSY